MRTLTTFAIRAGAIVLFLIAAVIGLLSLSLVTEPGSPDRLIRLMFFVPAYLVAFCGWRLWTRAKKRSPSRRPARNDDSSTISDAPDDARQ